MLIKRACPGVSSGACLLRVAEAPVRGAISVEVKNMPTSVTSFPDSHYPLTLALERRSPFRPLTSLTARRLGLFCCSSLMFDVFSPLTIGKMRPVLFTICYV